MHLQVAFLSLLTLASAAATPAPGQNAAPVVGPASSSTQHVTSIPDFSGMWGHPYIPSFDPPPSGPGPVVNKSRWRQTFGTDGPLDPATNVLVSNPNKLVGDYTNPILKPQAAEAVKKQGEIELGGAAAPVPSGQCWPAPIPYIFGNNIGMLMVQQPDMITILYDEDHEVRRVRMDRPHPAHINPSWYGDSVGHYEGDTLVIDTVGIKTDRPFAMIDQYGTPYTKALHVIERYRLIDYQEAKEAQPMTHLKSVSVVLGIALAAVAQAAPAQTAAAAKREVTFAACQKEADTTVPMRTTQDQMNHYLVWASCLEKRGITLGRRHSPGRLGDFGHR
jgi:hypothetical protein